MDISLEEATQVAGLLDRMGYLTSLVDHIKATKSREEMLTVVNDHVFAMGWPPPIPAELQYVYNLAREHYQREMEPNEYAFYIYQCIFCLSQHNEARLN